MIKGDKIVSKEPLRFKDELSAKILDILGDITLVGMPIKAHIVGVRPGHALNAELQSAQKKLLEKKGIAEKKKVRLSLAKRQSIFESTESSRTPLPSQMIDRVVEIVSTTN